MTLRRRVFGYVASAALAACLLTVGIGVVLVRRQLAHQRLAALVRQAEVIAAVGGAPGALRAGEHVYRLGHGRPRELGPVRARRVLSQVGGRAAQGEIVLGGRSLLYAARATPSGGIVLVRSAGLAFGEWRPFLWSLVLAGLGGALLAGLSSLLLARWLTRPIAALADATRRLAAGEAEVEVAVPLDGEDELAQLGRSFNRMAGALEAARQAQRRFLESVSHELKTPLTSIRGYGEALTDAALDPEQAGAVIVSEAARLERLVADLLDLARLGRAEFTVQRVGVDLREIAGRAMQRHRPQARELSVGLEAVGEEAAPAVGDPDRLVQAISNLIENALRVTPPRGSVTVSSAPGVVVVRDTGPGLSADELPHAFERFYLHDRHRAEREVGSGLGLAIVRELAERMGGSVSVDSAPGRGTSFTLRVPES